MTGTSRLERNVRRTPIMRHEFQNWIDFGRGYRVNWTECRLCITESVETWSIIEYASINISLYHYITQVTKRTISALLDAKFAVTFRALRCLSTAKQAYTVLRHSRSSAIRSSPTVVASAQEYFLGWQE